MLKSEQIRTLECLERVAAQINSMDDKTEGNPTYAIEISIVSTGRGPTPLLKIFKTEGQIRHRTDYQQASLEIDIGRVVKSAVKFWCALTHIHIQANSTLSSLFMGFNQNLQIDAQTVTLVSQPPISQHLQQMSLVPINWPSSSSAVLVKYDRHLPPSIRRVLQQLQHPHVRHVIAHFDIDVDGIYVQCGWKCQKYDIGLADAINRISILDDMLVGSHSRSVRQQLKEISRQYYVYTEKHIDALEDAQELLSSSIRKMVLKYPEDRELATKIPTSRLIVLLQVGSNGLIDGKTVEDVMKDLTWTQCKCLMLRFQGTEFQQNLKLLEEIVVKAQKQFSRIYVETMVERIEQVRKLWDMQGVIPVLGKSLFSVPNLLPEVISEMPKFQQGLVNCIIINQNGVVCAHRTMNKEQIYNISENRFIPQQKCRVKKMSLSCDGKSLLIVTQVIPNFCERYGKPSCFNNQSCTKTNLSIINHHIKGKINSRSYSGVMQSNPGLALAKVMEEFWEIIYADSMEQEIIECSDFLVHFLMYINGKGVSLETIVNILNQRAHTPQLISKSSKVLKDKNVVSLGILNDKYFKSTDNFILQQLGIRLIRSKTARKLLIQHQIVDHDKYKKYFGSREVSFLPMKSKDMPWVIAFGAIDGCITYSPVMDNYPKVSTCIHQRIVKGLKISLIKKKQQKINTNEWSSKNKAIIACQHVNYVYQFLKRQGIADNSFTLTRIVGSSQSYLITKTKVNFILCDAVVETGLTLEANDLEQWKTIVQDGQIYVGLYVSLSWND